MKIKNNWLLTGLITLAITGMTPAHVRAEDDALKDVDTAETHETTPESQSKWDAALKTKYSLTDEQLKAMRDKGLTSPQMAMTASLATASGKTTDEILKMRTEQKMGWGQIAKSLGLEPKTIGQSVRDTRHAVNEGRREDRKEARKEAKEQRKEERQARKEARRAAKAEGKHGH